MIRIYKKIKILDIKDFFKGKITYLNFVDELNKIESLDNNFLCSVGVIDLIDSEYINKNGQKEIRTHMITTLRDSGGATSSNLKTSTAGRMVGENIEEELNREYIEEAPFLGTIDGEFFLAIPKTNEKDKFSIIKNSINHFLNEKYIKENNKDYLSIKRMFERNFPGIKYSQLKILLENIVKNNRFVEFEYETLFNISELNDFLKKVTIGNNTGKFYTFYNKDTKTFEFKLIRKIKSFPNGFKHISKRPGRLFLESFNQAPRFPRLQNAHKDSAGAIKGITSIFKEKVMEKIK